ncbi:MAG TPA: DUF885 domain-containing protein [Azospirillaceae bacterium]|nr:DUF885 domain-containing protein [Azospirillaceae bacterium]
MHRPSRLLAACLLALTAGVAPATAQTQAPAAATLQSEDARLNAFFEQVWKRDLARDPQQRTILGEPGPHDRWTVRDKAREAEDLRLAQEDLARLTAEFRFESLGEPARVSYLLFREEREQALRLQKWRDHDYAVSQLTGPQIDLASFLIAYHRVGSAQDARDYVARLQGIPAVMDAAVESLRAADAKGIRPPAFAYRSILTAARNVVAGRPFDDGPAPSPLLADLETKVLALKLPEAESRALLAAGTAALMDKAGPAYRRFIAAVEEVSSRAEGDRGAWSLPEGDAYYRDMVRAMTTLELDPAEVHELGLREVARLQGELKAVMARVGFQGDLRAFFQFLRTDKRFYDPATPEGRKAYMDRATRIIARMNADLDRFFHTKPKAPIVVRAVEPFREKATTSAFYEPASPDGTRPGVFYANLLDMSVNPIYLLESLAYHEGIPGHHMQVAIAQEMTSLPTFRRFSWNSAYGEGWALYSELFPKEYGYYEDPYSDAGRIASELFRASRLVVDTGIHLKRWSREEAIRYMTENTSNPENDNITEVERYFVWPGQALAYKVGMNRIVDLRERARKELGPRFDIRGFHDTVLTNGSVTLPVLERLVDQWIASVKKGG